MYENSFIDVRLRGLPACIAGAVPIDAARFVPADSDGKFYRDDLETKNAALYGQREGVKCESCQDRTV